MACFFFYWCQNITTTKRRQQRRGGVGHTHTHKKWRHKRDKCGLWETKKKKRLNVLVLLHCSFHNVNHKKFQSSGKEAAAATTQVLQPFFFFFLDFILGFFSCKVALALCFSFRFVFSSHPTCLNEEEETFGLSLPGSSSRKVGNIRNALLLFKCLKCTAIASQRRHGDKLSIVPLVLMITVSCVSFFFFFFLLPYLRLKGHSAVPRNRRIVESQSFCFSYALKRRSPHRRPTDRLKPVAERRHLGADSAPKRETGQPVDFRKPQSPE